jgi:glycerol transport system substrate-binding protein
MARMQAADEANNAYSGCGPRLNEEQDAEFWLSQGGAPWPPLDNEKPQGETIPYEELIQRWTQAQ